METKKNIWAKAEASGYHCSVLECKNPAVFALQINASPTGINLCLDCRSKFVLNDKGEPVAVENVQFSMSKGILIRSNHSTAWPGTVRGALAALKKRFG